MAIDDLDNEREEDAVHAADEREEEEPKLDPEHEPELEAELGLESESEAEGPGVPASTDDDGADEAAAEATLIDADADDPRVVEPEAPVLGDEGDSVEEDTASADQDRSAEDDLESNELEASNPPTTEATVAMPMAAEPTSGDDAQASFAASVAEDNNKKGEAAPSFFEAKPKPKLSKNALIGVGVAAAALALAILFMTHAICFHKWSDPTCTEAATCSVCGRTKGEALGHDWQEATCTDPATCSRCGLTEGKALGHTVTKWAVTTEATCTKAGVESGKCDRCGQEQTRELPMVSHEFGEWKTTKEATCAEKGEKSRTCKNCGKVETEPMDMLEHTPGDWEITKKAEPTITGGSTEGERTRRCTVCGAVLETEKYTLSEEEIKPSYIASCEEPSFEDVARYPDDWDGKKVKFTGEVIQVMQDGNEYTLRVNVTDTGYYWTDTIMVYYEAPDGAPRILEDDVMSFYGVMSGMYSYESVMGATITVPLLWCVFTG